MMKSAIHLTDKLQTELISIGSTVILQTEANSGRKFNYKEWAWAKLDGRQVQVSNVLELDRKQVQLADNTIVACSCDTNDLNFIAQLIDLWLSKKASIVDVAKQFASISISSKYQDMLTLSDADLLSKRWEELLQSVSNGNVNFSKDLFSACMSSFSYLYPFFSHDHLWFSKLIALPRNVSSFGISFRKGVIQIGSFDGSIVYLQTSDIPTAISKLRELIPSDCIALNPLKVYNA